MGSNAGVAGVIAGQFEFGDADAIRAIGVGRNFSVTGRCTRAGGGGVCVTCAQLLLPDFGRGVAITCGEFARDQLDLRAAPGMATVLFTILELGICRRCAGARARKKLWLLPLIFVAWANIHIRAVYGLGWWSLRVRATVMRACCAWQVETRIAKRSRELNTFGPGWAGVCWRRL